MLKFSDDLESEIIFMTKGEDNGLEMQVWQKMKTGWYQLPNYIPPMPYSEYPVSVYAEFSFH